MIKTRLAVALSLALLVAPITQAAKYRVVELDVAAEGESSFPTAINEDGNITVNVTSPYDILIDLDLLNFESETLVNTLTDVEAASNGNVNDIDYEILLTLIRGADGSQTSQQIASTVSFLASTNETNFVPGFDQRSTEDNEYSISTNTNLRDINDSGFAVGRGEGFYNKVDYSFESGEDVTFVVNDIGNLGFATFGNNTIQLTPPGDTLGGFSEAFGINESNQVVGYGSVSFLTDDLETAEEQCEDDDVRGDIPFESCISTLVNTFSNQDDIFTFAQVRGLIWQLDDQGNLLDTQELGLVFTPEADDTANYFSQAFAINDNGIAVGISNGQYTENGITVTRNFGVIFDGDEVINLTPDPESIVARSASTISTAAAINNDNIVVGYESKSINGSLRTKFFVFDMNLGELNFPDDFFQGSSSVATDINNNGMVVGYGEVDASLTGRRNEGFLYDYNTGEFNGIRDLISCDSPYTIVQANAINDQDEIAATALYQGPARDSYGEVIIDSTGSEVMVDIVAAVKLEPIAGGEVENCDAPADEVNRERQGAGISSLMLLGLTLLGWRRLRR